MSAPSSMAIDAVVTTVAPFLRKAGFARGGRAFHAGRDGLFQIVAFEASEYNGADGARFTANLLLTSRAFHEAHLGQLFPSSPGLAAPFVQARIGRVMPAGQEHWWKISTGQPVRPVAEQVALDLRDHGLPFLARFPSPDAVFDAIERGEALPGFSAVHRRFRVIHLASKGRRDEAAALLRAMLSEAEGKTLDRPQDSIRCLARRLGLPLD